ncbi:MAG: hypothetical protein JSR39_03305 [Verrucomicrobia bacterium]|nr:hypothetical protein [Verrucomicrobiota bacterium]
MSLLRKPDEKKEIKPVISLLLPSNLEALKKSFHDELDRQNKLLEKIMHNIHTTVNKMHADPEQMWMHIDFQAEAIDQIIQKFCVEVRHALEEKSPPDTFEEEQGINFLVQQLEWDLDRKYCVEDYVENLLGQLGKIGPETLSPSELLKGISNPSIHRDAYNIAGYPGRPLPTSSWWLYLADRLGPGFYPMTVVSDGTSIQDPLACIAQAQAQKFKPNAQIGEEILIPSSTAFRPNVDQGCYLIKNNAHGLEFIQSEQFRTDANADVATFFQTQPYTLVAGTKEVLQFPPTITSFDDHCATLHYQAGEACLTAPVLRGSPFITLLFRNCTPSLRVAGMTIRNESIQAHSYFLVVPDEELKDPRTQIASSTVSAKGIQARIGEVVLIPNLDALEGQIFSFQIHETEETYLVFSPTPIAFKTVNAAEMILLPEGVSVPEGKSHQFLESDANTVPYSTRVVYADDAIVNGIEAIEPCGEATLRIAKVPNGSSVEEATFQFLQHAWVYATGGTFSITGNGAWKYTYTVRHLNPLAHLKQHNPPQIKKQDLLIALLNPDFSALEATTQKIGLSYQTLHGPARFAIAADQELNFSQEEHPINWPDAVISQFNQEQLSTLVGSIIQNVSQFDIKARGASSLKAAQQIQYLAQLSHSMFTLLSQNQQLFDNNAFMAAFQTALCIAKAGLDDYLSGGQLQYDEANHMVVTALPSDEYNTYGQDHHRTYGYLIQAAAAINDITPDWFKGHRKEVVNLLINDICCPFDQSPYFPKMRMWDPYTGLGRGSGAVAPGPDGMAARAVGEELNSLLGIALWAKSCYDKQLESFAATLAGRLYASAQAYCLPGSPSSIYTETNAPEAAAAFAEKVVCCSLNTDIQASSQNNFSTLAEQASGSSRWIDAQTTFIAFQNLFNCNLNEFDEEAFLDNFATAPLFQNALKAIPSLIPLIARVSPHTAIAILDWYMRAHQLNPTEFPLPTDALHPILQVQVFAAMHKVQDPVQSPIPQNLLPPLPQDTHPIPLQFWLEKTNVWLHSPNLTSNAFKIAESLQKEIQTLIEYKGTMQDLHMWARSIILPSIADTYPGISYNDLYPFCVITQTDPQEALQEEPFQKQAPDTHLFQQQEEPAPKSSTELRYDATPLEAPVAIEAPAAETPSIEPAPLFSSSQVFGQVKAEVTAYLSERTINLYHAQSFLGLAQEIPSTDADWRKLSSIAQFKLQQLQSDIASCRSPAHWTALAAKYGFRGALHQIQKQAAHALRILSDLFSARLALSSFIQALTRITTLEMADGSLEDLSEWASEFNTSGFTPHDLAIWKLMETEGPHHS